MAGNRPEQNYTSGTMVEEDPACLTICLLHEECKKLETRVTMNVNLQIIVRPRSFCVTCVKACEKEKCMAVRTCGFVSHGTCIPEGAGGGQLVQPHTNTCTFLSQPAGGPSGWQHMVGVATCIGEASGGQSLMSCNDTSTIPEQPAREPHSTDIYKIKKPTTEAKATRYKSWKTGLSTSYDVRATA